MSGAPSAARVGQHEDGVHDGEMKLRGRPQAIALSAVPDPTASSSFQTQRHRGIHSHRPACR
jgi:hypothetical protein